jgi:hypothetical protein
VIVFGPGYASHHKFRGYGVDAPIQINTGDLASCGQGGDQEENGKRNASEPVHIIYACVFL